MELAPLKERESCTRLSLSCRAMVKMRGKEGPSSESEGEAPEEGGIGR